jgi:hypothetical protein
VDPFLLTHKVRDGLYDIGPHLSPISIRDQMIRGYALVTRAIRAQIIGPDKPLLVVGAGAAGATAAMIAADRNINTTVLDRADNAFSLQAGSGTRYLDPTMYDWPLDHWAQGEFPWVGRDLPLRWQGGLSSAIAGAWEDKFKDELEKQKTGPGLLNMVFGATLQNPNALCADPTTGLIQVWFTDGSARRGPYDFAMILSCIGAGSDRIEIEDYKGKSFWENDSYSDVNLGLPKYMSPRVLISGSGDGALQDFLRIVTNKNSAKAIYQSLPPGLQSDVGNYLRSKEDHYQRAFTWSGNHDGKYKVDDCNIQSSLHEAYFAIVVEVLGKYKKKLKKTVEPILRGFPDQEITLAFEGSHFSHCYALNHFLVLFLALYVEQRFKQKVLYPNTRVVRIKGSDGPHVCNRSSPDDCEEKLHEAYFITADCEAPRNAPTNDARPMEKGPYNIVILRHGIDWNTPLFKDLPQSNLRHLLPYHPGWEV